MNRFIPARPVTRRAASRLSLGVAAALSALILSACGGGGGSSTPPAPQVQQPTPAVASLAPTTVVAGNDVTLTGTNLDQVRSATLNGVALTLRSQSATSAVFTVPATATSGFINITDSNGSARALSQQLNVLVRIAVTGFTPARALAGGSVTINGSGFARVREVRFTGAAAAATVTTRSDTQLVVTVPADATTGLITLVGETANDPNPTASNFELVPPVLVNASAVYAPAAGASFNITGTGLSEVTGASIAGVPAVITNATATTITVQPGASAPCGAIVLVARLQPTVAGGTLATANQCEANVRLAEIDVAQVYSQSPGDQYQRLVPGKETWIRAFVVSTAANRAAPSVRVTGLRGTTTLGTVNLSGPATLPQVADGAAIPSTVQYDLTQTFAAELPAAWIAPNLTLRVEVDPDRRNNAFNTADSTPAVGTATRLTVMLVPVITGGNTSAANPPALPTAAQVIDEVARSLPIARDQIAVQTRSAYTSTTTTDGLDTSAEWSSVLGEINTLRRNENPTFLYYGVTRRSGGSIAGIGYVNSASSTSPALTSLGWSPDQSSGWGRTMIHEFGHNFSRSHAPCGGVTGADPNYPYSGGQLGPTGLFNSNSNQVVAPGTGADIMGYCNGTWFSDYNFSAVQNFLEQQRARNAMTKPQAPVTELAVFDGVLSANGLQMKPAQYVVGPALASTGDYRVVLRTADGRTLEQPVELIQVDHADEWHFSVALPNPGAVVSADLVTPRGQRFSTGVNRVQAKPQAPGTAVAVEPSASLDPAASTSQILRWSADTHAWATVMHVADTGERTVLAVRAQGGSLKFDPRSLPAGGRFEVGVSDGASGRVIVLPR
jgi:hypothetical protein